MTRVGTLLAVVVLAVAACSKTSTAPTSTTTTTTTTTTTPATCAAWAAQQKGTGVPPATPVVSAQRQALLAAGGGIKAVGSKYYAAYFPSAFATSTRRVLVALHGTGGSPEAEWNDWRDPLAARGWGYLGLKYLDDNSGAYDNEVTIYANLKSLVDDVRASCDLGSASLFLVGFSRGSAESFPVGYLDLTDRHLFKAVGNNSGSWAPGGDPTPTLMNMAARGDKTAMSGLRFWMYCGEQDFVQGWPMCEGMAGASAYVQSYGATVGAFFRDSSGMHGGLVHNSIAMAQMFSYFEGL